MNSTNPMKVYAYLCDSMVCTAMQVDLDRTCAKYGVDYSVRDGSELRDTRLADAKGRGPEVEGHWALLKAAGWDGEFPAFVLEEPAEIEGGQVQAFGGEGWPAFCRHLMAGRAE